MATARMNRSTLALMAARSWPMLTGLAPGGYTPEMTERERILCALGGRTPDRPPWATRLDLWLEARERRGALPDRYRGASVMSIYRDLGVGRQSYVPITVNRLRGVEMLADLDGAPFLRQRDPLVRFPLVTDLVPRDRPGVSTFTFKTPVGDCRIQYTTTPEILATGTLPFLTRRSIAEEADFATVFWILDRAEVLPEYGPLLQREKEIGGDGLAIGMIDRVPFQRVLLDFLGEERTFFEMYDEPARFSRILGRLEELRTQSVALAAASPAVMVEHSDNVDGEMTNPRLFARYCIPALQRSAEAVHGTGKYLASHMDGDLSALLDLVPDSGVDVVESFSPEPLSRLSFRRAWERWRDRVVLWGCLASPRFESQSPAHLLESETREVLACARTGGRLILGIADQAVGPTLEERIRLVTGLIAQYEGTDLGRAVL